MTTTIFLTILFICATVTSLVTEGIKRFLEELRISYVANILVLVVALIIGIIAAALYYINAGIPFTVINIVYLILLGIANWLCAMFGYDKVMQTISQLK